MVRRKSVPSIPISMKGRPSLLDHSPSSGPLLDVSPLLPCDDAELQEADLVAHAHLQSVSSSPPGRGSRSWSKSATGWSCAWDERSATQSRQGTGRFSSEELTCFRRVLTPSSLCQTKAKVYWQTTGEHKRALSETGWHSLPVLKGKFYSSGRLQDRFMMAGMDGSQCLKRDPRKIEQRADSLPGEALTAMVLDEIYPRTPLHKKAVADEIDTDGDGADAGGAGADVPWWESAFCSMPQSLTAKNKPSVTTSRRLRSSEHLVRPSPHKPTTPGGCGGGGGVERCTTPGGASDGCSGSPGGAWAGGAGGGGASPGWGGGSTSPSCAKVPIAAATGQMGVVIEFRRLLLEKWNGGIREAIDSLTHEFPVNRQVTKKEWRRVLQRVGLEIPDEDAEAIFRQLDFDVDGRVSQTELCVGLDAAASVRTLLGLRRRWLASGYSSMSNAISVMEEHGASAGRRMVLREFGEALSRVHINDHAEHEALFNMLVADPSDLKCNVSVGELASAIATVSPALVLEDVRDRLLKKYGGNIEKAYWEIDAEHSGKVRKQEFLSQGVRRLGLGEVEADKVFRRIDDEGTGEITRLDFLRAFALSEPSLFLEDLRQKIRQRFRSIQDALVRVFSESTTADTDVRLKPLGLGQFQDLLLSLDLMESETRTLFELVDLDRRAALTVSEFVRGMRLFAPAGCIEDLRLLCLSRGGGAIADVFADAFAEWGFGRSAQVDLAGFLRIIADLNFPGEVQTQEIFDILDVKNEGVASLGRLVSALQVGGAGSAVRVPSEERTVRAKHDVRGCMAPAQRLCGDLKNAVRLGARAAQDGSPPPALQRGLSCGDNGADDEMPRLTSGQEQLKGSLLMRRSGEGGGSLGHGRGGAAGSHSKVQACCTERRSPHLPARKSPTRSHVSSGARLGGSRSAAPPSRGPGSERGLPGAAAGPAVGGGGGDCREEMGGVRRPSPKGGGGGGGKYVGSAGPPAGGGSGGNAAAPRLRTAPQQEIAKYALHEVSNIAPKKSSPQIRCPINGTQRSWSQMWGCLRRSPNPQDRTGMEKELQSYFQTATWSLSQDSQFLERMHSRFALYQNTRTHYDVLEPDRAKGMA